MRKSSVGSFIIALIIAVTCLPASIMAEEETVEKKEAKGEMEQFDPQGYTCTSFLSDLEAPQGEGEEAGMALIWAHGFHSALFGTDEVGALNEEAIGEIAIKYGNYCKKHKKQTFSRAAYNLTKDDD